MGAGALIVETTWMRWLRAIMGATAPAVSAGLVALTLGQLGGALLGARLAARSRRPTRAFALVMAIAGALALAVEPILGWVTPLIDGASESATASLTVVRLGGSLVATLPASIAIGTAFPLLVAAVSERARDLVANGPRLYAADLLGAALGAGLTAFWLPATLGVHGAYRVGVVTLLLVAALGLVRARDGAVEPPTVDTTEAVSWPPLGLAVASALSGFGVFAAQLLLHQAFGRVLDQSTYALGAVLMTTLAFLALGALVVAALERRFDARTLLAVASALAVLGFAGFPRGFSLVTDGLALVISERGYVTRTIFVCAVTAGPALLGAAAVLPSLFAVAGRGGEGGAGQAGHLAGGLLAANTVGAVAGALAAPYVLLPTLELWPSFLALAFVYAALCFGAGRRFRYGWAAAIVLVSVMLFMTPWRVAPVRLAPGDTLVETRTSAQGLVAVIERGPDRLLQTDNHYVLGGTADTVHQERQGHLPMLLHPSPKQVAFFGTATGSSAGAALLHDVARLVTVEIMPGVTEAARAHFGDANHRVYEDPRTDIVADDARSFFRRDQAHYDVIVGDLFVPWRSETGALYTLEHFEHVKARLAPGGLFCQWLPLYQLSPGELDAIMATFLDVFPDARVYRGDFYGEYGVIALVGTADGVPPATGDAKERADALGRRGVTDRWVVHPQGLAALYVGPLSALAPTLEDVPRNTNDRPVVEFAASANPSRHAGMGGWTVSGAPFLERVATLRAEPDPAIWTSPDQRRASAAGEALHAASTHWTLDDADAANDALLEAAALLAPELVSDAPPDPTAADVWPVAPSP